MSDTARDSVDIPLSKTLVALKRVRSLRDPSTFSLSKLATALENNANWETNSAAAGVILELNKSVKNHLTETATVNPNNGANNKASFHRKPSVVKIRGLHQTRTKLVHRVRQDRARKSIESTCVPNLIESKPQLELQNQMIQTDATANSKNKLKSKSGYYANFMSRSAAMSRAGSPCLSVSEARTNGSRPSTMGTRVRSNDIVGSNFSGCGISYCWSGASKYRDMNFYSDSDGPEQPLLSTPGTETTYNRDVTSFAGTPRSLSQKFRPRSFNELVGLNVVSQSLLYASCKGKIAPIYLFHGPRGTGKTSMARIFAASLNCLSLEDQRPCGFCRECVFMNSGKCRDLKEFDASKIDRSDKVKSLLKSASLLPYSSRFRVFIIDECHMLREEAWLAILKSLDEPYRHSVYIMVTSDLDEVPRTYLSHCQKYHFPKIKIVDIIYRLQRICVEEGLDFDKEGLSLIAAKSNGSLRDAETMLDQLGLLGKRITVSLVHELIGSVSDDDLIELLDLALSSDTTNTVRRARELMASAVDPLQLVSQLANLIMDILAGRCQSGLSDVSKNFFGRYALAEAGMRRLRHALKILSETEKHLRTSKNQATWVTVALLQFGSGDSSLLDMNDSLSRTAYSRDEWVSRENVSSTICYACSNEKSNCSERHCRRLKLENIWRRAIGKCQSKSIRNFLRKEGYLSSVHVTEELAIAEVGFGHPDLLSKADKLQTLISSSLQHVLGCDVEVRLKLVNSIPITRDNTKTKRQSFSLLSCSGRKQDLSDSGLTDIDIDDLVRPVDTQISPYSEQLACVKPVPANTSEDDTQRIGAVTSNRSELDAIPKRFNKFENDYKTKALSVDGPYGTRIKDPDLQPSCFARTVRLQRRLFLKIQPQNKADLSVAKKDPYETYFYTYDRYNDGSQSNSQATYSSREENISMKNSRFGSNLLCWRTPKHSI